MGPFLELVAVDIRRRLTQPPAPAAFSEAELDGQVLAPHQGFHWSARVAGVIGGFDQCLDGRGQLRWKLLGLVPVMRADGPDVARSAVGRAAGEAMWLPTTLLPRFGVEWEALMTTTSPPGSAWSGA